jgi:glycosyltransferase involved in cell wall biosynthesis
MNLLISAIACGYGQGSEPGVGWNTAMSLSKTHKVTVLAASTFRKSNDSFGKKSSLPFDIEYFDIGGTEYSLTSKQAYNWHISALKKAKTIVYKKKIDAAIHSTFIQYRLPFVASRLGIPYVVGPIGGAETVPIWLMSKLPYKQFCKESLRHLSIDTYFNRFRDDFPSQSHARLLCSCPATLERLRPLWKYNHLSVLPAISIDKQDIVSNITNQSEKPFILYAGRILPEKGISILFEALSLCNKIGTNFVCKIVGAKNQAQQEAVRSLSEQHNLPRNMIEIIPFIDRAELKSILSCASAFVYPAFRDSGSMALLEALAAGAWPICLDLSSQHWLPSHLGTKIKVTSHSQIVEHLSRAVMDSLQNDRRNLTWNNERLEFLTQKMTWRVKAEYLSKQINMAMQGV